MQQELKTKICSKATCQKEKSINEFGKDKHRPDGLTSACKECKNTQGRKSNKKQYEKNKEKRKADAMEYYYMNKEKCKFNKKAWYEKNKEGLILDNKLKKEFGISLDEYNSILISQNYKCACCPTKHKSPENRNHRLVVDHNHKMEHVRGLLCYNCNVAIGFIKDSPLTLRKLIDYLYTHDDYDGDLHK